MADAGQSTDGDPNWRSYTDESDAGRFHDWLVDFAHNLEAGGWHAHWSPEVIARRLRKIAAFIFREHGGESVLLDLDDGYLIAALEQKMDDMEHEYEGMNRETVLKLTSAKVRAAAERMTDEREPRGDDGE